MNLIDLTAQPEIPDDFNDVDNDQLPYILEDMSEEEWGRIVLSKMDKPEIKFTNLSLHSPCVFIGDIDFSENLSSTQALDNIRRVEQQYNLDFRVYQTTKGFRVINTQEVLSYSSQQDSTVQNLFRELKCDEKYVTVCSHRSEYAARLTPKTNREYENTICVLVKSGSPIKHPEIFFVVKLHDYFCLDNYDWCEEWRSYNKE